MTSVILNGNPYSATGAASGRDLVGDDRRGHTRWLLPMLADAVLDLGAKQSACASAVSAALAHVATAQDWAIKTSGPVSGSEYSAKYHAQAAAGSASTAGGHASAAVASAFSAGGSADRARGEADRARGEADRARGEADRARGEADRVAQMDAGIFSARLSIIEALVYAGL